MYNNHDADERVRQETGGQGSCWPGTWAGVEERNDGNRGFARYSAGRKGTGMLRGREGGKANRDQLETPRARNFRERKATAVSTAPELVVAQPELDLEGADAGVLGPLQAVGAFPGEARAEGFALDAARGRSAAERALALAVLLRLGSREVHRQRLDRDVVFGLFGDDDGGRGGCRQGREPTGRARRR